GAGITNAWASEESYYDYATNTCEAGKVCSHYTQIVRETTIKLGCGINYCPSLLYPNLVVCNYSPAGNQGQQPY
ncbi:MAG: SCP-like extracellular, partial [bacterium]|nr:SCP-like extracellular [bacterium]